MQKDDDSLSTIDILAAILPFSVDTLSPEEYIAFVHPLLS